MKGIHHFFCHLLRRYESPLFEMLYVFKGVIMKRVELLAPAGGLESFYAAVKAGADAVYMSGHQFGARKSAVNFTVEELQEAIVYGHLRGIKLYITVNTLIADQELADLFDYCDELYTMGIDAFIVQDLGVFKALKDRYPQIEIHCSTQMALHNLEDIKTMKSLGASRVVVPREMSAEEVAYIHSQTDMPLEAFVHGALCVCVSGQCLMSSMIGGRSGNRGNCAQSCRQRYKLKRDNGLSYSGKSGDFLLSPKDLCTLESLETIVEAGVTSLKIEGRMKGPEYTYEVTKAYRDQLDQLYPELVVQRRALQQDLLQSNQVTVSERKLVLGEIFSRDFTKGYILGEKGNSLMSNVTPGNRGTFVGTVDSYDNREKEMVITLTETLNKGDDVQIRERNEVIGGRVEYIVVNGSRVESASAGTRIKMNFKHDVSRGDAIYRTFNAPLMKSVREAINDADRTVGINVSFSLFIGRPGVLTLSDAKGHVIELSTEQMAEKANKSPLTKERLEEQLSKFGGTAYHLESLTIETDELSILPIKVINQLRRDAAEAMDQLVLSENERELSILEQDPFEQTELDYQAMSLNDNQTENDLTEVERSAEMQLVFSLKTLEQLRTVLDEGMTEIYYMDWKTLPEAIETAALYEVKLFAGLGRHVESRVFEERLKLAKGLSHQLAGFVASSPGQLAALKSFEKTIVADYTLNLFNRFGVLALETLGANILTLSLELNHDQIERLVEDWAVKPTVEIIGYGRMPVMITKYCPINGALEGPETNCTLCRTSNYSLVDKTGAEFPIITDENCLVEFYNGTKLNILDEILECKRIGVSRYRLSFVDETPEDIQKLIELHREAIEGTLPDLKGKGYTKGHFRRGILGL